jgi:hypothetical protein
LFFWRNRMIGETGKRLHISYLQISRGRIWPWQNDTTMRFPG